jgi:SpoU rRNA methylase family enzyme
VAAVVQHRLLIVLYDVSSAQRLIDTARLAYALGFNQVVAVKAYGAAASSGVPEVNRLALRMGKGFAVLPSLRDMVEIYKPEKIIVVTRDYGEPLEASEIAKRLAAASSAALVLGGIDPAPGKEAASIGEPVYLAGTESRLGPVAEAAIILYELRRLLAGSS